MWRAVLCAAKTDDYATVEQAPIIKKTEESINESTRPGAFSFWSGIGKNSRSSEREFFIQADRLGISSRHACISSPKAYIITRSVHLCRLDDIQRQAVDFK